MLQKIKSFLQFVYFKKQYPRTKIYATALRNKPKGFHSQESQDAIIATEFYELLNDGRFPRTFVDIGCNQPVLYSNSYFFERWMDFKCYGVDPLKKYSAEWREQRPNADLTHVALGAENSEAEMTVFVNSSNSENDRHPPDMFSTLTNNRNKGDSKNTSKIQIRVQNTQDYLLEKGIDRIGIINIDVEGFEQQVLNGIDFNKTTIFLAIVENNTNGRQGEAGIRELMKNNGMSLYARIWGSDDIFVNEPAIRALTAV